MKILQKYSCVLLVALSLMASCKKGAGIIQGTPVTPGNTMQLAKTDQDANNYATYAYNADGLLTTLISVHNQVNIIATTVYDANKQPISITVDDEIYKPIYTDGKISRINIYEKQNPQLMEAYFAYTYVLNKIIEADYYVIDDQQKETLAGKATSDYNAAGDLINQKMFYMALAGFQLVTNTSFEYDNKKNPLNGSFTLSAILLGTPSTHNITKQTIIDITTNVIETDTYTITYNSNNYPVQTTCKTVKTGAADVTTVSRLTYK